MSTEQEISGAEREAMKTGNARIPNLSLQSRWFAHAGYNHGWNSAKEYFHNSIVEQCQRADMAEEREKELREALENIGLKAALITADDDVTSSLLVRITAINEEARSAVRNA